MSSKIEIDEWIGREQHKHFCHCGCGGEINVQRHHFRVGVPKYISGHNTRVNNPMDNPNARRKVSEALSGEKSPLYGKTGEKHPRYGKHLSEETKKRISESLSGEKNPMYGKCRNDEVRRKISGSLSGEKNPMYGKCHTEETKKMMSIAQSGEKNHLYGKSGENHPKYGKHLSEETKKRISEATSGEKHPQWRGGISFEPYCHKFNETFKELIREKFGRVCFLCPTTEEENGKKLSVHHVNYDKNCLCDDVKCEFVPLCIGCHSKTGFDRDYWENTILTKLGVLP